MKKGLLLLGAVVVAIIELVLFLVLFPEDGAAGGAVQTRAYLPVVENRYEEIPLATPVAWRVSQLGGPPGYVTSLAATSDGALLALSLTDDGIRLSRLWNDGRTWSAVGDNLLSQDLRAYRLYSSPDNSREGVAFAIGFSGLARSVDAGATWQRVGQSLPIQQMVALASSPEYETVGTVYALSSVAGETGPYIYVSRDHSENWQVLGDVAEVRNNGLILNDLAAFDPGGLAIATSRGILRTADSGATWHHITEPFAEPGNDPAIRAVARLSSGEFLAISSGRRIPYKSTDGGLTWQWTGNGMDEAGHQQGGLATAVAPGRVFLAVAGAQSNAPGLFYSPRGESWRAIPLGLESGAGISALYAISDDQLLVAAGERGLWRVEAIP